MPENLTQEQFNQVIAEIQKISDQGGGSVTIDQAREILQEMNLPSELLQEALLQVKRKQAQAEQNRLNFIVVGGAILILTVAVIGTLFWQSQQSQVLEQVKSQSGKITLAVSKDKSVQVISPPNEIAYSVILENAPVGQTLSMGCNWSNPQGITAHQNRYQTKQITTVIWNTQCKYKLDSGAALGKWQVTMLINDRPLSTTTFEVK